MAGRDHDAAIVAAVEGGEVHAFRAAHTDVVHVDAAVGQSPAYRIGESRAAQADIAADNHALRIQELGVTTGHPIGHVIVEFIRDPAA